MNRSIIIFGTGSEGRDAIDFFGISQCAYAVKDLVDDKEEQFHGIPLISFNALKDAVLARDLLIHQYDVVIALRRTNIWGVLSLSKKLDSIGANFHIWQDVQKRWKNAKEFIERDRIIYHHERETLLEIRAAQRQYMLSHVDPRTLLPATGQLRENQLKSLGACVDLFDKLKEYDIHPIMDCGTLLGSLRHKGFIPWDDDLDFVLIEEDIIRLFDCFSVMRDVDVFFLDGFEIKGDKQVEVWKTKDGKHYQADTVQYACCYGYGYLKIYCQPTHANIRENKISIDIFPLYYFSEDYTEDAYNQDMTIFREIRKTDLISFDRNYLRNMKKAGKIVEKSRKIGFGHPLITSIQLWAPGYITTKKLFMVNDLLPPTLNEFEGAFFYQPSHPINWLITEGISNPMELPNDFPFDHHSAFLVTDAHLPLSRIINEILSKR